MVQRFDPDEYQGALPDDDGDYVLYEDYAALEQENAELKEYAKEMFYQKEQAESQNLELDAENAALRKRLEPIEEAYSLYKDYPMSAMAVRSAYYDAIKDCMELKEGE